MDRRKLLVGSLGLLAAPLAAEAQAGKVRRIGYLSGASGFGPREEAFRQGLRDLAYVEGQNIVIELVINLKTAKALGLAIPQSVLLRADQVIQ